MLDGDNPPRDVRMSHRCASETALRTSPTIRSIEDPGYDSSVRGVQAGHRDSPTSTPCSYTATSRNGRAATLLS